MGSGIPHVAKRCFPNGFLGLLERPWGVPAGRQAANGGWATNRWLALSRSCRGRVAVVSRSVSRAGLENGRGGGPFLGKRPSFGIRNTSETKAFCPVFFLPLRVQMGLVLPMFLAPDFAILRFSVQNRKSTINVTVFCRFCDSGRIDFLPKITKVL